MGRPTIISSSDFHQMAVVWKEWWWVLAGNEIAVGYY
jgi:hypothetical protein